MDEDCKKLLALELVALGKKKMSGWYHYIPTFPPIINDKKSDVYFVMVSTDGADIKFWYKVYGKMMSLNVDETIEHFPIIYGALMQDLMVKVNNGEF